MVTLPVTLLAWRYGVDVKRPLEGSPVRSLRATKTGSDEIGTPAPPTYTDKNGVLWVIFRREGSSTFPYLDHKYKAHSYGYAAKGWAEGYFEEDFWLGVLKEKIDAFADGHESSPSTWLPKADPVPWSPETIGKKIGEALPGGLPGSSDTAPAPTPAPAPIPLPKSKPKDVSEGGSSDSKPVPKPEKTSTFLLAASVLGAGALGWVLLK